jgi:hypothetical protein
VLGSVGSARADSHSPSPGGLAVYPRGEIPEGAVIVGILVILGGVIIGVLGGGDSNNNTFDANNGTN